jgi:hypothetical protein
MPMEHEKELRDFARQGAKLAKQIRQDWGSAALGSMQQHEAPDSRIIRSDPP